MYICEPDEGFTGVLFRFSIVAMSGNCGRRGGGRDGDNYGNRNIFLPLPFWGKRKKSC